MNFKKIALTVAIFIASSLCQAAEMIAPEFEQIDAIAWDLHDVVFKHDKRGMLTKLREAPWKKLLFHRDGTIWKKNFKIIPAYIKVAITQAPGAGDQYYAVAEELDYAELQEFILEMTTKLNPMQETVDFIKNNPQISHYIASNMGKHALEQVKIKFSDVFEKTFKLEHPTLGEYTATSRCIKPSQSFFDRLVENVPHAQRILFIDDNAKNVSAANKHKSGKIIGIQFTGPETLDIIAERYGLHRYPESSEDASSAQTITASSQVSPHNTTKDLLRFSGQQTGRH